MYERHHVAPICIHNYHIALGGGGMYLQCDLFDNSKYVNKTCNFSFGNLILGSYAI